MTSRHRSSDNSEIDGNHCQCRQKRKANSLKYGAEGSVEVKLGNDSSRNFRVDPQHAVKITAGNSEVTVSTQKTRGTVKPAGCSNPMDCPRMANFDPDLMLSKMTEEDRLRLDDAIKEACDSVSHLKTFDDVEELVEIHSCTEIQRKLASYINEKRYKMKRNKERREAELLERQQDFHKRVMARVKADNLEMSKTHQHLLETLGGQERRSSPSSSREEIEVTHSQIFSNPRAESTRLSTNIKHKMPHHSRP